MAPSIDTSSSKYLVKARIQADGIVEKPDVVGAIFGQTEGLLGEELDLRDLQKSGRIGRIEVELQSRKGKAEGEIYIPCSLDQVETAILASALETIDRVGPCKAVIKVIAVEDTRSAKRKQIIDRAKDLLAGMVEESKESTSDLIGTVRASLQVAEIIHYGKDKSPAGPNVEDSDAIIVVEGRNDVIALLKAGIRNAIAVEGTNIPDTVIELTQEKVTTVFMDGDRGGNLILKELLEVCEVDYVARAPPQKEVEELTQKQIMKALRNKVPGDQGLDTNASGEGRGGRRERRERQDRGDKRERRDRPERREPEASTQVVTEEERSYGQVLRELNGTSAARLFAADGTQLIELPVKDLVNHLRDNEPIPQRIIFEGVVTQKLIDISANRGIPLVVGTKLGSIPKMPEGVRVLTLADIS